MGGRDYRWRNRGCSDARIDPKQESESIGNISPGRKINFIFELLNSSRISVKWEVKNPKLKISWEMLKLIFF